MSSIENIEKVLEEIAYEVDGYVYHDYSGRGMFGKTCYGIVVCSDFNKCLEIAESRGLRGGKVDKMIYSKPMGLEYIIYWPDYSKEEGK